MIVNVGTSNRPISLKYVWFSSGQLVLAAILGQSTANSTRQPYTSSASQTPHKRRMQHPTKSSLQLGKDRVQHHQIIHRIQQLDNHLISASNGHFQRLPENMNRRVHHDRLVRVNDLSLVLRLISIESQHLVIAIVQTLHDEVSAPGGRRKRGERRVHLVHQHHDAARIRDRDVVVENLMSVRVIQHRLADLQMTIQDGSQPASRSPRASSRRSSPSAAHSFR